MITLDKALSCFSKLTFNLSVQQVHLAESQGYVLVENMVSDINMPPFDKSAMDGYACKKTDLNRPLEVIEFISAGKLPEKNVISGTCSKIMTGAKIPVGADCVVMVEHTQVDNKGFILVSDKHGKDNICYLGEDILSGDTVLTKGSVISPAHIAVAASMGKTSLKVYKPPVISLISTGDELIEPNQQLKDGQIRNSNAYNIQAQIMQTVAECTYLGIIGDNKKVLKESIEKAFDSSDILILTGGVSMGDKDYVPDILKTLGLTIEFEQVAIQPGKPMVFAYGNNKFCFALSGNPVSSMLQFELFVRPFIYRFMGGMYRHPKIKLQLTKSKTRKKTERTQFFPVYIANGNAELLEFHGSAHIAGIVGAHGFGIFPIGERKLNANDQIEVLLLKQY